MKCKSVITIKGVEYPVVFNMQTMLLYEQITGCSFFTDDFSTLRSQIAVLAAAVISADEHTPLTYDDLAKAETMSEFKDINMAYAEVSRLFRQFFEIPEVEKQADQQPEPEPDQEQKGDHPKN